MKRSAAPSKSFKVPWKKEENKDSIGIQNEPIAKKKKFSGESPLKSKEIDLSKLTLEELEKEETRKFALLKQKQKEYEALKKKVDDLQTDLAKKDKTQLGNVDGKLEKLTEKWTRLCQDVLLELQQKATNPTPIGQMLVYFGIEPTLLDYKEDIDGFEVVNKS